MRRFIRTTAAAALTLAATASAQAADHTVSLPDSVIEAATLSASTITVSTNYNKPIVRARAVALRGAHDSYVVCEAQGGEDANANRSEIGNWETFIMLEFSDGKVALRTRSGKYLKALGGGGSSVNCESTGAGDYSRWTMLEQADGTYAFKSFGNKYLVAESNGDLNANRTAIGGWEKFTLVDLGAAGMDAMPDFTLQYEDMDGDGDEEMILMVTQEDGEGFLMLDPLGIIDVLSRVGYGPRTTDADQLAIWDALSATQQAVLLTQADALFSSNIGDSLSQSELYSLLDFLQWTNITRTYQTYEFNFEIDGTGWSAGTCVGSLCTRADIGNYSIVLEYDEFGPGFELSASVAELSVTNGVSTVEVEVLSVASAADVDKNGFTFGASADLIGVSTSLGRQNGSYIGVSAGVGEGFWVDAKYGKGDQYGFTLDVPVLPVGVAIYVKGSDAVWVYDESIDWASASYASTAVAAEAAWNSSIDWAEQASDNVAMAVAETARDTMSTVQVSGQSVVAAMSDGTSKLMNFYEGAVGSIEATLGNFTSAVDDLVNGVSNAVEDAIDAMGDVAEDAGDFFCGLFGC